MAKAKEKDEGKQPLEQPMQKQQKLNLSTLQPPKGRTRSKKRVGRGQGSGTGKTAGRGHKGQKSRSGYSRKRGFEGGQMPLQRRVPKRGFHNPFRVDYAVVNLDTLGERFEAGTEVTPDLLRERGLVRRGKQCVKILARGDLAKPLTVHAHKFSGKAAEKLAAGGGQAVVLES
jgi:large subunit ribosomal protein L15|tara:strand:+ start:1457 stop:1975 length:519 start_codon:yes stop_codon:yes gene_type:complete